MRLDLKFSLGWLEEKFALVKIDKINFDMFFLSHNLETKINSKLLGTGIVELVFQDFVEECPFLHKGDLHSLLHPVHHKKFHHICSVVLLTSNEHTISHFVCASRLLYIVMSFPFSHIYNGICTNRKHFSTNQMLKNLTAPKIAYNLYINSMGKKLRL